MTVCNTNLKSKSSEKRLSEIGMIFNYAFLFALTLLIVYTIKETVLYNYLSNMMYSENATTISVKKNDPQAPSIITTELLADLPPDTILYKNLDMNHDYRAVYFNGHVRRPPLIEGRFFESADFHSDSRLAVIGKDALSLSFVNNEERFITFNNLQYRVIGVMGIEKRSNIDFSIFVNINSIIGLHEDYERYTLDSNQKTKVDQALDFLENNSIPFKLLEVSYLDAFGMLKIFQSGFEIFIYLFVIFVLASFSLSLSWFIINKQKILVRRIIGFSDFQILLDFIFEYVKIQLKALFISSPALLFFIMRNPSEFIFIGLPCILILIIFLLFPYVIIFSGVQKNLVVRIRYDSGYFD